ncbi:MAG TPA: carboxyl transferase domain-containing protein [Acidimicrobiales bacterium]|nr:carboxyl transferase domain-containing protein [Acidimicrobiales bacterium]
MKRLLIANRGEIAIRIAATAAEMGIPTVGVFAEDDAESLHLQRVDEVRGLAGSGPRAYLDATALVDLAVEAGCDALHPGYGFLSESAGLAELCAERGVTFIGPAPDALKVFGDKVAARALAAEAGVPLLRGTGAGVTLPEAAAFLTSLGHGGAVMVKAVSGGGGRGMRPVRNHTELADALERSASEAAGSGDGSLYLEELLSPARHIEVQVIGDGFRAVHLYDRDCTLQRRRQKIVETAPALAVPDAVRAQLFAAAVELANRTNYGGLGTFEFLVGEDGRFAFIEANPRLQVEHTVTEAVTGLDLVRIQLALAEPGATLAGLGLEQGQIAPPRGRAMQMRINLETVGPDGSFTPTGGTITAYELPSGPGVRVDGFGYGGYATSPRYDSLLAKVIVHTDGDWDSLLAKSSRALSNFRIDGVGTNLGFLHALLDQAPVRNDRLHTDLVAELIEAGLHETDRADGLPAQSGSAAASDDRRTGRAGADIDASDPLAVLAHGKTARDPVETARMAEEPAGTRAVRAPMQGTVVALSVSAGDEVGARQVLAVIEAMKMEHEIIAPTAGLVRSVASVVGEAVVEGFPLLFIEPSSADAEVGAAEEDFDPDQVRADLAEVLERHRLVTDEARPEAVERRRRLNQRTARENVEALCDPGSFVEYSPLTVAARRRRNSLEELIAQTPADGLIMGLATVNADAFGPERSKAAVMAYDYTVLAGTQGAHNHVKLDRMAELAHRWKLPTVFFTEGGGGRPGDTEGGNGFVRGFELWAQLSGLVPLVGVTSGRCFAGNAAILGCCDVIIATEDSALGMGGPAMIEGGGLGIFHPEEIGPVDVMQANGVIDVLVADEAEAAATARRYLSYFQGPVPNWSCADQRRLRGVIPENRVRTYDIRRVIDLLADTDSVLELRPRFGRAMITALVRIEGRPVGLIANNPLHIGGAIDSDASDKAARFLQICEAFGLPVLSLSDTPGNMVGPEAEKTGLIRHCSRLFVIGANLTVPILSVILRKSYGLGAIAMTGGSYQASMLAVSWPTGEFGGMGLEGAVKLGYRAELAAIDDPAERRAAFDRMVAAAYAAGKAVARATGPALDDVIDPADTRRWIAAALRSVPPVAPAAGKRVPWIDAW